jgi:hypothetical protein
VIRQAHLGEADSYPPIWVGRAISMSFEGSRATFVLHPIITSQRRPGLRRNYQYGCPHVLYGEQCRADKEAATVIVELNTIDGQTLIMPAAWHGSIAVEKYLGGLVQWETPEGNVEVRTILKISGVRDLVLGGLVRGLSGGQDVEVSLGCNHLMDDCHELHVEDDVPGSTSNVHNYGGQPWIPLENPVGRSQRINAKIPKGG